MIEKSPDSRRLIVSVWNSVDVPDVALPPCHTLWQVRILGGKLHLQLNQRSTDMFWGVPFFSGIAEVETRWILSTFSQLRASMV